MKKIICFIALLITGMYATAQTFTTITIPATATNLANIKTLQDAWASKPPDFTGAARISGPPVQTFLAPVMDDKKQKVRRILVSFVIAH